MFNQLKGMDESKKSDSSILRCLVKGIIRDPQIFAMSNAKIILNKYPVIDKACRGNFEF